MLYPAYRQAPPLFHSHLCCQSQVKHLRLGGFIDKRGALGWVGLHLLKSERPGECPVEKLGRGSQKTQVADDQVTNDGSSWSLNTGSDD